MTTPFTPIEFEKTSFNCPICGAFSEHVWSYAEKYDKKAASTGAKQIRQGFLEFVFSECKHCKKHTIWLKDRQMIYPSVGQVQLPNEDLPEDIKNDYNEAKSIVELSPRGAAALLRLALQKLCKFLGESGENINNDIANLVKKGLPPIIQQALDSVRVIGNNAVHPGVIDLTDDRVIAYKLFDIINISATSLITHPKQIAELYGTVIPENLKNAIDKRDGKI